MKLGTLTVSGGKFRLPCVYEFLRDGEVMYVGRSDAGFSRAFKGIDDRQPARKAAFEVADQVRVTVFDSAQEARDYEFELIQIHKPLANKQFNRPKSKIERNKRRLRWKISAIVRPKN